MTHTHTIATKVDLATQPLPVLQDLPKDILYEILSFVGWDEIENNWDVWQKIARDSVILARIALLGSLLEYHLFFRPRSNSLHNYDDTNINELVGMLQQGDTLEHNEVKAVVDKIARDIMFDVKRRMRVIIPKEHLLTSLNNKGFWKQKLQQISSAKLPEDTIESYIVEYARLYFIIQSLKKMIDEADKITINNSLGNQPALRNNRKFMLAAFKQAGGLLEYVPAELRECREIVQAAVSQNGEVLEYASAELRADPEIVLTAVIQKASALNFASEELRADRKFMLELVKRGSRYVLLYATDKILADREFVLAVVSQNGIALEFLSAELQADREVVLAAVSNNENALEFSADALRTDPDIMHMAINKVGNGVIWNPVVYTTLKKYLNSNQGLVASCLSSGSGIFSRHIPPSVTSEPASESSAHVTMNSRP